MIRRRDLIHVCWIFVLLLFLKFFVVEPFRIPTGSMIPSILVGDHLFVGKSAYDVSLPFRNIKVLRIAEPQRGDIIVFEYPNHEKDPEKNGLFYIKRLIGLPGDRISVVDGFPVVNGVKSEIEKVPKDDPRMAQLPGFRPFSFATLYLERLPGTPAPHWVQRYDAAVERYREDLLLFRRQMRRECLNVAEGLTNPSANFYRSVAVNAVCEFDVPADSYFAMGDNRDDSEDGRLWGFVPRKLLRGRGLSIWLSISKGSLNGALSGQPESRNVDPQAPYFIWSRFGQTVK